MTRELNSELLPDSQPILIVEDSMDDFEATKRAFWKVNLRNAVRHVLSGEEALSYLRSDDARMPGLILLDLNMPGMDGRKTLEIIKRTPGLRKIPVVILTTSDDERDVQACYELGANTYIQKPVDFDGLIAAIKRLKEYWFEIALLPKEADDEKPN
jgi:two-component system response regulator